jgi:hypothetical protein
MLTKKSKGNGKCKEKIEVSMFIVNEIKWDNKAYAMLGTEKKICWSGEEGEKIN